MRVLEQSLNIDFKMNPRTYVNMTIVQPFNESVFYQQKNHSNINVQPLQQVSPSVIQI